MSKIVAVEKPTHWSKLEDENIKNGEKIGVFCLGITLNIYIFIMGLLFTMNSYGDFRYQEIYPNQRENEAKLIRLLEEAFPIDYRGGILRERDVWVDLPLSLGFFEALKNGLYTTANGDILSEAQIVQLKRQIQETTEGLAEQVPDSIAHHHFYSETVKHRLRNEINRIYLSKGLEKLNVGLSDLHDKVKLVEDINFLRQYGYPKFIPVTINRILVEYKKFKKSDLNSKFNLKNEHGDLVDPVMAFAIHELNRIENAMTYNYLINYQKEQSRFVDSPPLAELVFVKQVFYVRVHQKAILSMIFDILSDHVDFLSRSDLGNPADLVKASLYLADSKKAMSQELKTLIEALGSTYENVVPILYHFEENRNAQYFINVGHLVSRQIRTCRVLF